MKRECDRIERDVWLLESGELDPDRATEVREHLAACAACRSLRAAAGDALGRYDAAAAEELDDVTFARLVRAAREQALRRGPLEDRPGPVGPTPSARWRATLAGAVAGVVILALGLALGRSTASDEGETAALRNEIRELRSILVLSSLDQPSASARLRGIAIASEIDEPRDDLVDALLRILARDPTPNVRLAAVDALSALPAAVPVERRLTEVLESEPTAAVRIAIIDLLVARRVEGSLETLRRLERDAEDPAVRRHASWAVEALT